MTIEVVYVKLKKNKIIMSLRGCVKKIINKKKDQGIEQLKVIKK
jgi:hypothetical protein